ncbi:hypothetical protein D770_03935 [Flammeovirgaceae bacterium 311]|nr:hypothetical protein D770_03935 [Flammeovirgaceae bacterium 311]
MKAVKTFAFLICLLSCSTLFAQRSGNAEQMEVLKTFNLFFEAMRARDTLAVKDLLLHPHESNHFFQQSGFSEKGNWASSASVGGFLKDLSIADPQTSRCNYDFKDCSIEVFDKYAILSVKFKCFQGESQLANCGKYTVRLLKTDQWKLEQVYRYVLTDRCAEVGIN